MRDKLFLGVGKHMIPIPRLLIPIVGFAGKKIARMIEKSLRNSMSKEHHAVRDFVVKELPRVGSLMTSEFIAEKLSISVDRAKKILKRLERMILLDMNEQGAATWAYPVTIVKTPHHATLSSGEQTYIP